TLILTIPMILLAKPKGVIAGWILLALGELIGSWMLAYGVRRLAKTININQAVQLESQPHAPKNLSTMEREALPSPPASITEGTTELINSTPQVARRSDKD